MAEGSKDIRWKQRLQNLSKAFARLDKAVDVVGLECEDDLMEAGLIQFYEFTYELAWKTLKDLLAEDGFTANSPREVIRTAFANGYIRNGELWMQALNDRNLTTHTYDDLTAKEVVGDIVRLYHPMLRETVNDLKARL